jgi:hypothetical protein
MNGKSCRGLYSELELTTRNFYPVRLFPSTVVVVPSITAISRNCRAKLPFFAFFERLSSPPISDFSQKMAVEIDEFAEIYANFASCENQRNLARGEMIKMRINFRLSFSSLSSNFSDGGWRLFPPLILRGISDGSPFRRRRQSFLTDSNPHFNSYSDSEYHGRSLFGCLTHCRSSHIQPPAPDSGKYHDPYPVQSPSDPGRYVAQKYH